MIYLIIGVGIGILFTAIFHWFMIYRHRKKRKIPSLTKYVVFSLTVLIIYYIAEFIVAAKTGIERSTLSTCITGVLGGEVLSCALIKIFKLKEGDNE